jgi:hypothetical protein
MASEVVHGCFDGLVLLGHGLNGTRPELGADLAMAIADNESALRGLAGVSGDARVFDLDRSTLRTFFYAPDVPDAAVVADEAAATVVPARAAAEVMTSPLIASYAASITIPVFLGFGARCDSTSSPHLEAGSYPKSSDVTIIIVEGSAHCHNLSQQRRVLWDRISSWAESIEIRRTGLL